ncbi:MAG: hypothetical protein HC883_01055 [Bdellovibrionaceae bacterium]|nr:hypothetical protein [Pseudobdellovibrionaceae bacterium]
MSETAEKIEAPQNIPDGNSELAAIVKESEQKIAEENFKKSERGRKRGPNFENSYYARKRYGTGSAPKSHAAPEPSPVSEDVINIENELVLPLILISKVPAMRTGIPELTLDEAEAKACASSLQRLIDVYAPDLAKMDPKTAAIMGAVMTFGTLVINKLMIYSAKMQQIIEMRQNSEKESESGTTEKHFEPTPQEKQQQESAFPASS